MTCIFFPAPSGAAFCYFPGNLLFCFSAARPAPGKHPTCSPAAHTNLTNGFIRWEWRGDYWSDFSISERKSQSELGRQASRLWKPSRAFVLGLWEVTAWEETNCEMLLSGSHHQVMPFSHTNTETHVRARSQTATDFTGPNRMHFDRQ